MAKSAVRDKHRASKRFLANWCGGVCPTDVDWNAASDPTKKYNCMGFAVGDLRWWQPKQSAHGIIKNPHRYWPDPATDSDGEALVESYVAAAKAVSFVDCENSDPEDGFEKIVLYYSTAGTKRLFQHAARCVGSERVASKLGPDSDVEHPKNLLDGVIWYGKGRVYLKRALPDPVASGMPTAASAASGAAAKSEAE